MNDLEQLRSVMPPPSERAPVEVSWKEAEEELGVQFSQTYKALIETYGTGRIGDELLLLDPRRPGGFRWFVDPLRESIEEVLSEPDFYIFPDKEPILPVCPGPGERVLPLAGNGNGSDLYALVEDGVMRDDRVRIMDLRSVEWVEYPVSVVSLLLRTVTGGWDEVLKRWGNVWDLRPEFQSPPTTG